MPFMVYLVALNDTVVTSHFYRTEYLRMPQCPKMAVSTLVGLIDHAVYASL